MIRKADVFAAKEIDAEKKQVTHVISTGAVDHIGDIIEPSGWDLRVYKRNPVVLLNHSRDVLQIIGTGNVRMTGDALISTTTFGDTPLAWDAFNLVEQGLAKAWSVGFRGIRSEAIRDKKGNRTGTHFTKQLLLEYSLVAIPMNPEAVNEAVATGLVQKEHVPYLIANQVDPSYEARKGAKGDPRLRRLAGMASANLRRWGFRHVAAQYEGKDDA